jgi:hypothetical protein
MNETNTRFKKNYILAQTSQKNIMSFFENLDKSIKIVTGLACSSKTTEAKILAETAQPTHVVLSFDNYRYSDEKWTKKDYATFKSDVFHAIKTIQNKDKHVRIVLEGAYNDASDPEQARMKVINELIDSKNVIQVIVLTPKDKFTHIMSIVKRSISRENGEEPQGACPETPESATKLISKCYINYSNNMEALQELDDHLGKLAITTSIDFNRDLFKTTYTL